MIGLYLIVVEFKLFLIKILDIHRENQTEGYVKRQVFCGNNAKEMDPQHYSCFREMNAGCDQHRMICVLVICTRLQQYTIS